MKLVNSALFWFISTRHDFLSMTCTHLVLFETDISTYFSLSTFMLSDYWITSHVLVEFFITTHYLCLWLLNKCHYQHDLYKLLNLFLRKGLLNICLKFNIVEKWGTQNFDFLSLKSSFSGQFLRSPNSLRYHWIFNLFVET